MSTIDKDASPAPTEATGDCREVALNAPYGTKPEANPTPETYGWLDDVRKYCNQTFFEGELPHCLMSLQRARGAYGYFDARRFSSNEGDVLWDEIALNPEYWGPPRTVKQSISTLVHEMVHQWQALFGKPGRGGYHNVEFSKKMFEIGLVTSDTGERGGRRIGHSMSHYIYPGGRFDRACDELLGRGYKIPYVETWAIDAALLDDLLKNDFLDEEARRNLLDKKRRRVGRSASKSAYVCPNCEVKVWGKPHLRITCGDCETAFVWREPTLKE
jgi:hypothetical protein